jgi:hypothetical protein
MFDWLRRMVRRRPSEPSERVVEAEHRQQEQFDAWDDTMKEVERVQRLARPKVHITIRRGHR